MFHSTIHVVFFFQFCCKKKVETKISYAIYITMVTADIKIKTKAHLHFKEFSSERNLLFLDDYTRN
jgi:hypothetical protein